MILGENRMSSWLRSLCEALQIIFLIIGCVEVLKCWFAAVHPSPAAHNFILV
jgi:hypothetical protein